MGQEQPKPSAPHDIVRQLRALMPHRQLTYSESLTLAERQANEALKLVGVTQPGTSLGWITELPRTEVKLVPRYKMDRLSGATTFSKGRYLILVNKGDPQQRRRFTLAHEWKHLLDYAAADLIHAGLGRGDPQRQARQIEEVANYFAACLLMPKALLRRAWTSGIQDLEALAGLFDVSVEAMQIRLTYLGFLGDESRPVRTYFRRPVLIGLAA